MTAILGPDGDAWLNQSTHALTGSQVDWFLRAPSFLAHVPHLWTVTLKLVCGHCRRRGLDDRVVVRHHADTDTYWVRCACAPTEGRLPSETIQSWSTDELLARLGWDLVCADCGAGVTGANDPQSTQWTVICPCRRRIYVAPAVPLVAVAH